MDKSALKDENPGIRIDNPMKRNLRLIVGTIANTVG